MEGVNNKQTILLVLPFVAVSLAVFALSHVKFKPALLPVEQRLSGLAYEKVKVIRRRQPLVVSAADSPIALEKQTSLRPDYPQVPLSTIAPLAPQEPQVGMKISFILISGGRKMAIIDGKVVNEGDMFNQKKVAKIEKNRVLLKNKQMEEWIKIE